MKGQPFGKRLGFALHACAWRWRGSGACALICWPPPRCSRCSLWWALLALAVGLVLVAELFNSALETLLDHLHPGQHPEIGTAKDIAAGAVLVACAVAVLAGAAFLLYGLA